MTAANQATRWDRLRVGLALVLAIAGMTHLVLVPDHVAESTLMGLGFVGAAVAELGLAALVLLRPDRPAYWAAIAVATGLIVLYAFSVMIGLPFAAAPSEIAEQPAASAVHEGESEHGESHQAAASGEHSEAEHAADGEDTVHHADGLVLGAGEPVDAIGGATKALEAVSVALAFVLQRRRSTEA